MKKKIRTGTASPDTALSVEDLERALNTTPDGLSRAEAGRRIGEYGYNEIVEERVHPFIRFLSYFWGPIPWMIITAALLSGVLHHWDDVAVIAALLVLNAVVGFREEYQAGSVIEALKKTLALSALAKRDGAWAEIPARELVPGDMIRLRIGDIVPADVRLLGDDPVEVDQSALTGESLPVERKRGDTVYSGSILRQGETEALVYATGSGTYYGRTAELVRAGGGSSHLQRAVITVADYLIVIALALAVAIIGVALTRGDPILEVVQFALVLTVAAVPVAMPAVLSVTMAIGAGVLARKQAIVTRLTSIEELAGIDILCSDKTGTLTKNELTLGDPFVVGGGDPAGMILVAALASRAEDRDPIDTAVIGGVREAGRLASYQVMHFMPFDPVHKRTEAAVQDQDGNTFRATKGAPQVVLELDPDADAIRSAVEEAIDGFAAPRLPLPRGGKGRR